MRAACSASASPTVARCPLARWSMDLHVRIGAPGVPADRLRALVEGHGGLLAGHLRVEQPLPVGLHIDVSAG
jgi:hypothetical protein